MLWSYKILVGFSNVALRGLWRMVGEEKMVIWVQWSRDIVV